MALRFRGTHEQGGQKGPGAYFSTTFHSSWETIIRG